MNRREFFAGAAAAGATLLVLPTLGCPSQSQIAQLVNVLGTSAANIANLEGNPALGAKLLTDTAAAVSAVNNWKNGTVATMAIEALNLVMDDLNLFPAIGPYGPLIDLAIGTVIAILALLPQSAVSSNARQAPRRPVTLVQPAPKTAKEYKKQFNAIVDSNPKLASAKIK